MDLRSLKYIFKPKFWLMNEPFDKHWDIELNYLLNNYRFIYIDKYTAKLGDRNIWLANHPYASFSPYPKPNIPYRASRLTIERARKQLIKDLTPIPKISGYNCD